MATSDGSAVERDPGPIEFFEVTCPHCSTYMNMAVPSSIPLATNFTCPGCNRSLSIQERTSNSTAQHNISETPRHQGWRKSFF